MGKLYDAVVKATVALLCVLAVSVTSFAYFSYKRSSSRSVLQSARFDLTFSLSASDSSSAPVITVADGSYSVTLLPGVSYTVTLAPTSDTTALTGFCSVSAEGVSSEYVTRQFDTSLTPTDTCTFDISVSAEAVVSFVPTWGTSVLYADYVQNGDSELYITDGEIIALSLTLQ